MRQENHQEEQAGNGNAIDSAELDAIAGEAESEERQSAGELMEEQGGPTTAEILEPLVSFGCDLACPNYRIKSDEKKELSESYGELIDKYFPGGIGNYGVELNALLVTAAIFGPRVAKGIPAREKPPEKASEGRETETHEG